MRPELPTTYLRDPAKMTEVFKRERHLGLAGPNIRMRIYAYDGEKFATRWMPANVWGAFTVTLTEGGFRIDGQYYQGDKDRHDAYLIGKDGLYLCRPRQCQ